MDINYLNYLDDSVFVFGVHDLLRKYHNPRLLFDKVHYSTYYYWLEGKTPVRLGYLKQILPDINEAYTKQLFFSAGQKKVVLPRKMSRKLAYLIGCLHGDGSFNKNGKVITVTEECREFLSGVVNQLFLELFNIKGGIIDLETYYRLEIGSKVVHSFLSNYCPVGKKKGFLNIPKCILADQELIRHYLSGLFDTDGSLSHIENGTKSLFFVFTQADRDLVYEVYESLLDLGIPANKPLRWLSTNSPSDRRRQLKQWRIYIGSKEVLQSFLNKIPFLHPLKRVRAKMILNKIK